MSAIIAQGQKTVHRKSYREAMEAARYIANKHKVPALIVDLTQAFATEIIKPS